MVSNYYSANQLAYQYAFNQDNFNGAAAISINLLVVALVSSIDPSATVVTLVNLAGAQTRSVSR